MKRFELEELLRVLWRYVLVNEEFINSGSWRDDKKLWKKVLKSDRELEEIRTSMEKFMAKKKPMSAPSKSGKKGKIKAGRPC